MKKLLIFIALLVLGANGSSGTLQPTQEILSRPVFPKVDYEDVELKTTLRHLFQRPECKELGLSYGVASDVKECRVTIKEQQISMLQFLNLICLQNQLQFSFKDNYLHFYNDTRPYSFSQTTTGNQNIDAKLSRIIIPKLSVEEMSYPFLLRYLSNEAIKHSGGDKKEFIFIWKYDDNHADKSRINAYFTQTNLLSIIQKICKLGNLEFRYTDGILLFVPKVISTGNVAKLRKSIPTVKVEEAVEAVDCWSVKVNPGKYAGKEISINIMLWGDNDSFKPIVVSGNDGLVSIYAKAWRNNEPQTIFWQTRYPMTNEICLVATSNWMEKFLEQHKSMGSIAYKVTGTVEKISKNRQSHYYIFRISKATRGYHGGYPDITE